MASAFGLLLSVDEVHARYDYGQAADDPERGVLVIPVSSPEDWWMEGREDRPRVAGRVVWKALKGYRSSGEWPANASYFSC